MDRWAVGNWARGAIGNCWGFNFVCGGSGEIIGRRVCRMREIFLVRVEPTSGLATDEIFFWLNTRTHTHPTLVLSFMFEVDE